MLLAGLFEAFLKSISSRSTTSFHYMSRCSFAYIKVCKLYLFSLLEVKNRLKLWVGGMTLSQKPGSNYLESVYWPIMSTLTFLMEGFDIWRNGLPWYVDDNKGFNLKMILFYFSTKTYIVGT